MEAEFTPQQIHSILSTSKNLECTACGHDRFIQVMMFKTISGILSPTGKPSLVPLPVYECTACGNINPEFLPKGMSYGEEENSDENKEEGNGNQSGIILDI